MRRRKPAGLLLAVLALALVAGCAQASARTDRLYPGAPPGGSEASVAWLFPRGGGDAAARIVREIGAARKTLDLAVYSFTDERIAQAVLAAKRRGVRVRLITDREELRNPYQKAVVGELRRAGVPVEQNSHAGLMHLKVAVIDGRTVITGSYNWTLSAADENDENLLVIRDPALAASYGRLFESMWSDARDFQPVGP
ncbi:MAG: phospholipase D family protein [Bacillota bacterium]|nr:phospholipase D family protein [Bacillota bacterium]